MSTPFQESELKESPRKIATTTNTSTTTYAQVLNALGAQLSSSFNLSDWKTLALRVADNYIGQCTKATSSTIIFEISNAGSNYNLFVFSISLTGSGSSAVLSVNGAAPSNISSNKPSDNFGSNLTWDVYC